MSLSNPIVFAGVQSVDFISRSTKLPIGRLRVLQGCELSGTEIPLTNLTGGASKNPWATIEGASEPQIAITTNEHPAWLLELVSSGKKTVRAAEPTGAVTAISNATGTSILAGVTVAKTVGDEADLKSGRYYLKATAAKVAKVYLSGANIGSADFLGDDLEVFTVDLTTSPYINAAYGLTFTYVADFTIGDVGYFDVRAINTSSYLVEAGSETSTLNEVEIVIAGQLTSGRQVIVRAPRAKGGGLPLNFAPNTFSELSLTFNLLYCASIDKAYEIEYVDLGTSGSC
jgi:hypothetical protein